MPLASSTRCLRSLSSRCLIPTRRLYSSTAEPTHSQFSYALSKTAKDPITHMFDELEAKPLLRNAANHNAAVIVATPDFARQFGSSDFMGHFAKLLRGKSSSDQFHVLGAIVDQIPMPQGTPGTVQGISVLRGNLDYMLPNLWQTQPPKPKEDADAVSALNFNIGRPTLTLPLARTMFQNNKGSTLLASKFNFSSSTPQMAENVEKYSQQICLSTPKQPQVIGDLGLWAPLLPLTPARAITESFGNIVRGVQVDGQSIPASTELESAVNRLYEDGGPLQLTPGSAGVWALVSPKPDPNADDLLNSSTSLISIFEDSSSIDQLASSTAGQLQQAFTNGSRLFKILSGGGGWGPKKGLLSLDPQRTHFALSEEEEMQRFVQSMNDAGFAPPGARIQFLMSVDPAPQSPEGPLPSIVFGVPSDQAESTSAASETTFVGGHFGALSTQGIFLADADAQGTSDEMKLTVPNSRLYINSDDEYVMSTGSKFAASTVADAGFAAMLF